MRRTQLVRSRLLVALSLVGALACAHAHPRPAERDRELIAAVILDIVAGLPDSVAPDYFGPILAPTADSARALNDANWIKWWYTIRENAVPLPDSIRQRFARRFDLEAPPPEPWPSIDSKYKVSAVHMENGSTLRASIGVSFSWCTYRFRWENGRWRRTSDEPTDCLIS